MRFNIIVIASLLGLSLAAQKQSKFINDDGELTTSDSSVTLLRKLASVAPAMGNVQDRIERIHDLQPRIDEALGDAHDLLKSRKTIYKPQDDEECEDEKPKKKAKKQKKVEQSDSCCCDNSCSFQCNYCPTPVQVTTNTVSCCCDLTCGNPCSNCPVPVVQQQVTCCCDGSCPNVCNSCGQTVSDMARGALSNPYYPYFNAKKMSKVDAIENVDDLTQHALNTPT